MFKTILAAPPRQKIIDELPKAPIYTTGEGTTAAKKIVVWIIGVFWIVAVAMVIWAAFLYLTAGGNEEKIKEAKKRLLYAVIAAAIALSANVINIIVYNLLAPS
jgi:hypothetical protein